MRYEDLEDALKRQPLWEPPAGFARAVVARALAGNDPRPAIEYPFLALLRGAELAVASAALLYAGAWILWRLTPVVMEGLVANAMPVAWTCAALALLFAMWHARDRGLT
jgi:hypothetical protein